MRRPIVVQGALPGAMAKRVWVRRGDGKILTCTVGVAADGSLYLIPPRGEWLHEPPEEPMEGQEALADAGEAPGVD